MANIAKGKRIPVQQLDKITGAVVATHVSVQEASRAIDKGNGGAGAICNVINGKSKSAYGYRWRYVAQDDDDASADDGEEWKQFEDVFVSTKGRIKRKTVSGYRVYGVADYCKDGRYAIAMVKGRRWPVHRLMAVVFMDFDEDDERRVGFKDGDATNLLIDNIEVLGLAAPIAGGDMDPAYIAGMFDGDGSINVSKVGPHGKEGYLLKVELSQCNEAFLRDMNSSLGGAGKMYRDARTAKYTRETNGTLRFCGQAAAGVLHLLAQHAVIKAEQARVALRFIDLSRRGTGADKEIIRARMKELNADKTAYDKPWDRICPAYIAGLFDAEGNAYLSVDGDMKRRQYVKITQKSDPEILHRITVHLGYGMVREGCRWKIYSSEHVASFWATVAPHLRIKTEQLRRVTM